ncbi:MAG: DUF2306 domain-containing protein [Sandaracinaceae bacterium]|nr:DUF2306 domain-containing protein [Sandaracinaceae bacterium]
MAHDTALPRTSRPRLTDAAILAGLFALAAVPLLAGATRVAGLATGDAALAEHARFAADPVPAFIHILSASAYLVLGALQFLPGLRRRRPRWHRVAGRALAPLGIAAALSGIWMTLAYPPGEHDGPALDALRIGAGAAMVAWLVLGVAAARRRDLTAHGAWMTRAFALGLAPGTQALTHVPYFFVDALHDETGRVLAMAAGWAIHIVAAEWLIARRGERARAPQMAAVVYDRYGGPEVLRVARVARPKPGPGQVLVRVAFASINAADYRSMRADPFIARLSSGLFAPRRRILGADVAGVVEAVGPGVTRFAPGDAVFGDTSSDGFGAFAELACVSERALARVPEGVPLEAAAAAGLASVTAIGALARAGVAPGGSILIHGAGGGVGTALVQIAKARGLRVTAVCGPRSVALVRALGADRVLDHARAEHDADEARYDAVFGVNGYRPLAAHRARVAPGGAYVMVGGTGRQIFEALLVGPLAFWRSGRRVEVLTLSAGPPELEEVRELLATGALRPVIDRVLSLDQAAEAMRYVERGHVHGKVLLRPSCGLDCA